MRIMLLLLIAAAVAGFWLKDAAQKGRIDRYLDTHPNVKFNSTVEYYWGSLLELAQHAKSAQYRYRRVMERYPESKYAPNAWVAYIQLIDDDRQKVVAESKRFIETYASHPKAELLRKKLLVMEQGI